MRSVKLTRSRRGARARARAPSIASRSARARPIVLVLGMHRSGTSAITRALEALGVDLGGNLMPPLPDNNERGFFEDLDIFQLNERLLEKAASAWSQLAPIDADWAGPSFARERREAAALLRAKLGARMFAFKDPRSALLLPFWQCVFEDLNLSERYVVAVRNPIEAALSLEARDGLPLAKGVLLWAKHQIAAVRFSSARPRVFVSYERLLSEPMQQLQRLAAALGLDPPQASDPAARAYCDDFLTDGLRHNHASLSELARSGVVSPFVIDLYALLTELAESDGASPDIEAARWEAIEAQFLELTPLLVHADATEAQERTVRAALAASTRRIAQLEAALTDASAQSENLRQDSERKARRLREQLSSLAEAIQSHSARMADAAAQAYAELADARARAAGEADLRTELIRRLGEAESTRTDFDLDAQLASIDKLGAAIAAQRAKSEEGARIAAEESTRLSLQLASALENERALAEKLEALRGDRTLALTALGGELRDFSEALAQAEGDNAALRADLEAERAVAAMLLTKAREAEEHRQDTAQALKRERAALSTAAAALARAESELSSAGMARAVASEQHRQLAETVGVKDAEIAAANAQAANWRQRYRDARRDLLLARASLREIAESLSWRATAPMRKLSRALRDPLGFGRRGGTRLARAAWRMLPMSAHARGRLAARVFAVVPPGLLKWSSAYRAWGESKTRAAPAASAETPGEPGEPAPDPALEGCVPLLATQPPNALAARAIAFYLPQFHPIPENDAWWGKGFTEWTKVRPATPRFEGHYQPHEPGELGYYDVLADAGVMERQAELAQLHGLSGFCFYFYWFAGKRLLEAPIEKFAASRSIETPFCLCWANENWTRRWDGQDSEVLIAQVHSPEDDIAFIAHVSRYLRDRRYIRIQGRPLLLVYRPALLPSAKETAARWRQWLRENGFGEVYLAYTQSFERVPPADYGFDAAVEFPPNNMGLVSDQGLVNGLEPGSALSIYDWRALRQRGRQYQPPPYTLFRGVTPAWDNTARRGDRGAAFVNTSPSEFSAWMSDAVRDTAARFPDPEERLIFINAWNEWAEGAHLEPDRRYGYAWLEAARRALAPDADRDKVLVVTHDLHRHGAQFLALNLVRTLRRRFGVQTATLAGGPGALAPAFESEGEFALLDRETASPGEVERAVAALAGRGYRHAIVNSAASAWLAPALRQAGVRMIALVHEMPAVIASMGLAPGLRALDHHAEVVVFPAASVQEQAAQAADVDAWRNAIVAPQGMYKPASIETLDDKRRAHERICSALDLPAGARIVLGVGFADHRKGPDLFAEWAGAACARWPDVHFIWAGEIAADMRERLGRYLDASGQRRLHFVGYREDTADLYGAASAYALSSREDPFPSTALEALAAGAPVICVRGAGGIAELADHACVQAISSHAPDAFVAALARWLDDAPAWRLAAEAGRTLVRERFGFASYVGALGDALGLALPSISVVVPNYNYARHLPQRLDSILAQTLSPREIIFLDDASDDDSIAVAERVLSKAAVNWRIVRNERNSGDVFGQWRRGVDLAQGEFVWIAEADDWADARFLETVVKPMRRPDVVMSMTQSQQVNSEGQVLAGDYLDYVADISPSKWRRAFMGDGAAEVREGLSIKNTIPNASAVLFRRAPLAQTLRERAREIGGYRVAGDWCVYVNALREGRLAFSPAALNFHRRHDESVTISRFGLAELAEIARMQTYVWREFETGPEIAQKGREYLRTLVAQFGLEQRFSPSQIEGALRGFIEAPRRA